MQVKIIFFGATVESAGTREVVFSFTSEEKAGDVISQIVERFPKLNGSRLLYALNQEYATGNEIVKDGDELAVFTAVSGG